MGKNKSRAARNAPKLMSQTITQSVSIGDQWDSAAFAKLLQEQAKSNETAIKQLETAMGSAAANQQQLSEQIAQSTMMKDIRGILLDQLKDREFERLRQDQLKFREQEKQRIKEANEEFKKQLHLRAEEAKAIANIAKGMETFKTMGDRFSDMGKKLKDNFGSFSALKVTALKAFNIGGIFNKSIAKEKFIQTQRKLGSEDDRSTLAGKFESANKTAKEIKKNEEELSKFKKDTGMSESELAKTKEGKRLLRNREQLSNEYAKSDLKASLVKQETPTQQFADSSEATEENNEKIKREEKMSDVLVKIEQNTRGASPDQKAKPEEEGKGGGLLGKLLGGGGMGKALAGLKDFGVGIVLVAGALWVASKAFKSFAEVAWEDIGKGLVVLGGLAVVARVLGNATGSLIKASVGLGALALVTWGASAAFKEFADLDWETIGKGFLTIIGLGAVGVVLGNFAVPAIAGAAALGLLGAAVWVVGKGFQEMGEAFNSFVDGIERLSNIGFDGLAGVAGGLTLLGGAMVAFAAGQAATGITNLVTGFLSAVTGQKTPVEQLIDIGNAGDGINKAGSGMQRLAEGMKAFSEIKGDSIKALKQFPWEEATKFVAAGGAMSADGAKVYNQSKANADQDAQKTGGAGTTNNVVAPVTNVSNTTVQQMRPAIRNHQAPWQRQYKGTVRYSDNF